mmetsp:Transcript_56057/g.126359  ORF Transcript_56057/g.126359 Transcript_56057/m.126359 type:complete len:225 (+) Transcript_56057:524-1198(+)
MRCWLHGNSRRVLLGCRGHNAIQRMQRSADLLGVGRHQRWLRHCQRLQHRQPTVARRPVHRHLRLRVHAGGWRHCDGDVLQRRRVLRVLRLRAKLRHCPHAMQRHCCLCLHWLRRHRKWPIEGLAVHCDVPNGVRNQPDARHSHHNAVCRDLPHGWGVCVDPARQLHSAVHVQAPHLPGHQVHSCFELHRHSLRPEDGSAGQGSHHMRHRHQRHTQCHVLEQWR